MLQSAGLWPSRLSAGGYVHQEKLVDLAQSSLAVCAGVLDFCLEEQALSLWHVAGGVEQRQLCGLQPVLGLDGLVHHPVELCSIKVFGLAFHGHFFYVSWRVIKSLIPSNPFE